MDRIIPYFRFKCVRNCVFAYLVATPLRVSNRSNPDTHSNVQSAVVHFRNTTKTTIDLKGNAKISITQLNYGTKMKRQNNTEKSIIKHTRLKKPGFEVIKRFNAQLS